jgi:hypothetical protein
MLGSVSSSALSDYSDELCSSSLLYTLGFLDLTLQSIFMHLSSIILKSSVSVNMDESFLSGYSSMSFNLAYMSLCSDNY